MISCNESRSLPLTRTRSPWMDAFTFFFESLMTFTIWRAFSIGMPCCIVIFCFTVLPAAGSIRQALERDAALDQFLLKDLGDRLQFVLVNRVQIDGIFTLELDVRLRILQVETGMDLLQGLLHGI